MRFAYIKPNNAVRQFKRVGNPPTTLPEGGPDAYVAHFLKVAKGHPCMIISNHLFPHYDEQIHDGNAAIYSYYRGSLSHKMSGRLVHPFVNTLAIRLWTSLRAFYKLVRFKPDVILCWSASFSLWAIYLASKILSIPFVYSRHSRLTEPNEAWYKRFIDAIDKFIIRRAAAVIVHGPFVKKQMIEIKVLPERLIEFNWSFRHFLDAENQSVPSYFPHDWKGRKIILFIGRLEARKGVFDLLAACQKTFRTSNECKLAYAGAGDAFDALAEKVKSLKMESRVKLLGMVPHDQLPHIIRDCYTVVTPSRTVFTEGRCMATMEGLVLGKPVIAPNNGPFPFLVKDNQNGLLFHPDSIDDLNAKINQIVDNEELYARLKKGAEDTGKILMKASVNFSKAVVAAFKKADIYN